MADHHAPPQMPTRFLGSPPRPEPRNRGTAMAYLVRAPLKKCCRGQLVGAAPLLAASPSDRLQRQPRVSNLSMKRVRKIAAMFVTPAGAHAESYHVVALAWRDCGVSRCVGYLKPFGSNHAHASRGAVASNILWGCLHPATHGMRDLHEGRVLVFAVPSS